jgi:hypothetical protein
MYNIGAINGRPGVVADAVRRYNPDFAAFSERLLAAGKAKKATHIALAHKLLVVRSV